MKVLRTINEITLNLRTTDVYVNGRRTPNLTAKEFALAKFFIENKGSCFSRTKILEAVWGHPEGEIDSRTVDQHVSRLRQKVGKGLIESRVNFGYRGIGGRIVSQ